ncbi:deubiquitinase [Herbaspirillum sp. Sphag1AN]|uniref:hypothetical protein n=1 Tax=unclassified Herbaspirillum TaxID=2624150 RepID=UPI001615367C|nr:MULTISPECIES: hypothetical protein [unclassified Herbaspirillum]MBB3211553.1 deubiquitinase [Herbaspirillum sp. Sphag1AN]MBB3245180.1 deubiquitinase [Herbaspirillum sp. Sphag64]
MIANTLPAFSPPVLDPSPLQEEFSAFLELPDTAHQVSWKIKDAVRRNNSLATELLFSKACSGSPLGRASASFLLALYSGKEGASNDLMLQLGKDSLKLCEIVLSRNARKASSDQWKIAPKILVMAGLETVGNSQVRSNIVQEIKEQEIFGYLIEENQIDNSLFGLNRMITDAELNLVSARLNDLTQHFHFNDARKVTTEAMASGEIDQSALQQLLPYVASIAPNSGRFVPLLMDDHWILFGIGSNTSGEKFAMAFSSLEELKPHHAEYLNALGGAAGVSHSLMITGDLQRHAPNACGLFVTQAMERIAECYEVNKDSIASDLEQFIDSFQQSDWQEQSLFNRNGRAGLYGVLIDAAAMRDEGTYKIEHQHSDPYSQKKQPAG